MNLVLLIMFQDLEHLWKQIEVSSNKMLPSSKETTLLCLFFWESKAKTKDAFQKL
jgi:hypothetical protein